MEKLIERKSYKVTKKKNLNTFFLQYNKVTN